MYSPRIYIQLDIFDYNSSRKVIREKNTRSVLKNKTTLLCMYYIMVYLYYVD